MLISTHQRPRRFPAVVPLSGVELGPAEKEVMQTEPVQVIVLILAETPKTTPGTLPICPLVEMPKVFSGP